MNKSTIRIIVAVLVILLFIPGLIAQDKVKEDTPYWENNYYKLNSARIDSLKILDKKYATPVIAEAKKRGLILEFHTLIRKLGNEYNLIFMTKLPSWAALEKNWFWETFRTIEPNEDKRKEAYEAYRWVFDGASRYDGIYTELEY